MLENKFLGWFKAGKLVNPDKITDEVGAEIKEGKFRIFWNGESHKSRYFAPKGNQEEDETAFAYYIMGTSSLMANTKDCLVCHDWLSEHGYWGAAEYLKAEMKYKNIK